MASILLVVTDQVIIVNVRFVVKGILQTKDKNWHVTDRSVSGIPDCTGYYSFNVHQNAVS